ncbi:MAG: formimidoylglutamase [Myxococcales bacterium]
MAAMQGLRSPDESAIFHGTPEDPRLGDQWSFGPARPAFGPGSVALLGFADDRGVVNGGGRPGAHLGPRELRRFLSRLTPGMDGEVSAVSIHDLGDAAPGGADGAAALSIEETHALAEDAALEALRGGSCLVLLGGGHDGAFASHAALLRALPAQGTVCAINVDAHLDVRPLRDGQITSGTPFRRLKDRFGARYTAIEFGLQPQHNAAAHARWAAANGFALLSLAGERALGPLPERFARALALSRAADAVAVSLDLDSVQAASAPGVSAPCPDGFSPGELLAFARAAGREPRVRVLDVMELSPPLDLDGRTARLGAAAVWQFLAGLGERPP